MSQPSSPSRRRTRRLLLPILGGVLLIAAVCLSVYLAQVFRYQVAVREISISDIALSTIPDGTYLGECDVSFIAVRVSVTVKDGRISDIQLLEHKNDRGRPAERIVSEMLEQQRLTVDAVAGATNSSKVIQKAVENALTQTAP